MCDRFLSLFFLCNTLRVHLICFHGLICFNGHNSETGTQTELKNYPWCIFHIQKWREERSFVFHWLLSVCLYFSRVKCYSFTEQNISLAWLSKTNSSPQTLIGNIGGKKIPTSKWSTVRDSSFVSLFTHQEYVLFNVSVWSF